MSPTAVPWDSSSVTDMGVVHEHLRLQTTQYYPDRSPGGRLPHPVWATGCRVGWRGTKVGASWFYTIVTTQSPDLPQTRLSLSIIAAESKKIISQPYPCDSRSDASATLGRLPIGEGSTSAGPDGLARVDPRRCGGPGDRQALPTRTRKRPSQVGHIQCLGSRKTNRSPEGTRPL
jgi:hypothetical protein